MDKQKLQELRKQYPEEFYDIVELEGKLTVSKRRIPIRVYARQVEAIAAYSKGISPAKLSGLILDGMKEQALTPEFFEQTQILIDADVFKKVSEEAKKCGTRKITYLREVF